MLRRSPTQPRSAMVATQQRDAYAFLNLCVIGGKNGFVRLCYTKPRPQTSLANLKALQSISRLVKSHTHRCAGREKGQCVRVTSTLAGPQGRREFPLCPRWLWQGFAMSPPQSFVPRTRGHHRSARRCVDDSDIATVCHGVAALDGSHAECWLVPYSDFSFGCQPMAVG